MSTLPTADQHPDGSTSAEAAVLLSADGVPAESPEALAARRFWQSGCENGQAGRWSQAVLAFEQATLAVSEDAVYWFNLANAQRHVHQYQAALASADRGLELMPGASVGMYLRGESLAALHRYEEAAKALAAMEEAGHVDTSAMLRHASMLALMQRQHEAVPVLLRALSITPHLVRGHALLADAMRDLGLKREAVECMKTVLALEPGNLEALSHLSFEKRHVGDWSDMDQDLRQIQSGLLTRAPLQPRVAAPFGLLSLPLSPRQQLEAAKGDALVAAQDAPVMPPRQGLSESLDDRIRLGFVSFDFREHPVSQLLVQVLEAIDRNRFELFLYSCGPDDRSALRQRVQAAADQFVDLRGMSDQQAAERVRADGVHVLVDLAGHTRGNRLGVFARRPAPVQVNYLGYPGSTGARYIDYIVGDPFVTPVAHADQYSEKIAQLPRCMQPNGRWRPLPAAMKRTESGLPEKGFVMCAFNHTYKILPAAFDIWCQVLREVPDAVLWLKQPNDQLHDNMRRHARLRGVDPQRLVFAPNVSYAQHFSRLALADVFVDTWPYNAHTTASDALWAGVPVLTLSGPSFASRVATSIVHAAGLGELAVDSEADYLLALRALALQPELLAPYRQHLQTQRLNLPLFDCGQYALDLQALLTDMVHRWRRGLPPDHLLAPTANPDQAPDARTAIGQTP